MTRTSCARVSGVFMIPASGSPRFTRAVTPRISAARLASWRAELGRAARAHLPCVRSTIAVRCPCARGLEQGAATRELDIVAVRGDGQNVYGRHGENIRP